MAKSTFKAKPIPVGVPQDKRLICFGHPSSSRLEWIKSEASRRGISVSEFVRRVFDEERSRVEGQQRQERRGAQGD